MRSKTPVPPPEEQGPVQIYGSVEKDYSARFTSDFPRRGNSQPGTRIENPAGAGGGAFSPSIDGDASLHLRLSANGVRKVEAIFDPTQFYVAPADLTANPGFQFTMRQENGVGITVLFQSENPVIMKDRLFTIFPYGAGSRPGRVIVPGPQHIWPAGWLKLRITGANGDVIHAVKTSSENGEGEFTIEKIDRWRW
ncbi:hypothetical protein [Nitrospirillum amazonense]|uniref:Uncharacterized protein n=1 Tax=Nitrospirillum amazonense TaxID=28077 RepID=A0A560J3Q3_9PROT|nr:hypothetical protein [Nitrospirillum amazonense]MDG3443585.1 hypothetical protein [Nitrospirillum amazonense]TWB65701.1 hypothetical protein FBZ87_11931 [Nitrospirillum amazonense]